MFMSLKNPERGNMLWIQLAVLYLLALLMLAI